MLNSVGERTIHRPRHFDHFIRDHRNKTMAFWTNVIVEIMILTVATNVVELEIMSSHK